MSTPIFTPFISGYLSQWYPSPFTINNVKYPTAEHYMMAEKARLFNDQETLDLILKSTSPKVAKSLGRKVKNFDDKIWMKEARRIVFEGNLAKFQQNPELLKELLATDDQVLVEANQYDKIWAVAMKSDNPNISDPAKWKGTNWLGQVAMGVRVKLGGKIPNVGNHKDVKYFIL